MSRGKRIEPEAECEFCNKPLPILRHPSTKFCDPICRGRYRYTQKNEAKGKKCMVCGKWYRRVGSHVVQIHGYQNVLEYRREFGLMARETRTDDHATEMRAKASTIDNLKLGVDTRYKKGGDHGEKVKQFWQNREKKLGHRKRKGVS